MILQQLFIIAIQLVILLANIIFKIIAYPITLIKNIIERSSLCFLIMLSIILLN